MSRRVLRLRLDPPSLKDNTADCDRLLSALRRELKAERVVCDLSLLRTLPECLRQCDYALRCVVFREGDRYRLLAADGDTDAGLVPGLAIDLGTTRVVLRLVDLETGDTLGESAFDNPQITVGPDILARIHHCDTEGGLDRLHRLVVDGINREISDLCEKSGLTPDRVVLAAVAGNTAMTHLFLGITPHWMIREPYIPAVNAPDPIRASELGLAIRSCARIIVFPNVGSYFGGDLIAGILFSGMDQAEETAILVDVGTNAEVVLGNRDWLVACAGAAGPALESGVARMGMMAGPGVIDTIVIDENTGEWRCDTIGGLSPRGICGSGVIDLAAQLFLSGMLDPRGKLSPDRCGNRFVERDGMAAVRVVSASESATREDLVMTQADIDSLVRSKAAMYTILETLTRTVGMTPQELTRFHVAGTFGSFIKPRSAIAIGMIPDLPLECYTPLGNSSLGGAAMALVREDILEALRAIRDRITYIELNVNQELMNRFSAAKFLPHTDPSLFPSVRVRGL